ncbi:MAG: ribulose-phosphate 3-epimerase [Candidatus Micrarchaeota archaeon]
MRKIQVFPSLLSADFSDFTAGVREAEKAGADGIQLDVMDLHFVPNLSYGWKLAADLRKKTGLFFDAHLMVESPYSWLEQFAKAGADNITFHIEAAGGYKEADKAIHKIKLLGKKAGLAFNPSTPLQGIEQVIENLDYILIMTVVAGFEGQKFMPSMLPKIETARKAIDKCNRQCRLQVDGGINEQTAEIAKDAGADSLVTGSAFYGLPNPAARKAFVDKLKE